MTWNHRVIHKTHVIPNSNDLEHTYGIHEVYYTTTGLPCAYTEEPITLFAETFDSLRETLVLINYALDKPVLEHDMKLTKPDWATNDAH